VSTPHRRRPSTVLAATGLTAVGALSLSACGLAGGDAAAEAGTEDRSISIIATDTPAYSGPLEIASDTLEEEGYDVEITYVTDIVQPNHAVSRGEADYNFFQHGAYLQTFNRDNGTDVVPLFYAVGSPAGVYSTEVDSVEQLPDGARIAIPADPANNGRALRLLADAGRLGVEDVPVVELSQQDITDNPHDYQFIEVDQQTLTQTLPDVDAGFLFSRQAVEMDLDPEADAILREEDVDAKPYRIVVAGRPDEVGTQKTKDLQAAFQTDAVRDYYLDFYGDWAPLPWDEDPAEQLSQWWKG